MNEIIKFSDISSIQSLGSDISEIISRNGDTLLQQIKSNSTNEIVSLSSELLTQLNKIDFDEVNNTSRFKSLMRRMPLLNKFVLSVENVMSKYEDIASQVESISSKINTSKLIAMRDNSTLQSMFSNTMEYIGKLSDIIDYASKKEEELRIQVSAMSDSFEKHDMEYVLQTLQKKLNDLKVTQTVLTQNLYQIRAIQMNNVSIANKADNICKNVIPIWKTQLVIAVVTHNQKQNIEVQKAFTEATNTLILKNAENLRQNSIEVAKASEESVISADTLQRSTQQLMDILKEVRRIHEEAQTKRLSISQTLDQLKLKISDDASR